MRPVDNSLYPAMFYWIPMDIIHMLVKIILINDQMIPKAALP